MTIDEQVAKFRRAVAELSATVEKLDTELFLHHPGTWSPRDIVAHLIGWNYAVVEGSEQLRRGELPFYDGDPGEDYSRVNAELVSRYSSTDRAVLRQELAVSAAALADYLAALDAATWSRDSGVRHRGEALSILGTVDELIADYDHHRHQIEAWQRGEEG